MDKLNDNFYINCYKKGNKKFVVVTDKSDTNKVYSINAKLLEYILQNPKETGNK